MGSPADEQREWRAWKKQAQECYWCRQPALAESVFCAEHREMNRRVNRAYQTRKRAGV